MRKKYPKVRCARQGPAHFTTGKLFQVGSVRVCGSCSKRPKVVELAERNDWKIRRVRPNVKSSP